MKRMQGAKKRKLKSRKRTVATTKKGFLTLAKQPNNPIVSPNWHNAWEAWQTFNPAALFAKGKVRILYRALGQDGISRLGYAASRDGIHINERSSQPAYDAPTIASENDASLLYETIAYNSGGGFAGCEDARITRINDTIHMLYVAFDGKSLPRVAITSIGLGDFLAKRWKWKPPKIISPPGVIDKSACLFPEKINGKYAIMHRIFPNILIDYVNDLEFKKVRYLKGEFSIQVRSDHWDSQKIGAGAPPIKTRYGWLLIYYAVDRRESGKYKIGAMLLDRNDPVKVLRRPDKPILEPDEWYENIGHKAGVVYPCGAVVLHGQLNVYYGGADTVVCAASANLETFMQHLWQSEKPRLTRSYGYNQAL